MKKVITAIIRYRNPAFQPDKDLGAGPLFRFALLQAANLLRGCRLLLRGRLPKFILLGRGVRFFCLSKTKWGRLVRIGDHVFVSALGKEGIVFGDGVGIGAFSRVVVSTTLGDPGKFIRIGHHVGIGEFAYLGGAGGLDIGDDCIIGQYFSCHPENHLYENRDQLIRLQGVSRKGISIGPNCWIGSKVTILDGVLIGEGCVIAAGAVVTRSMPPNSVVGGVPAKVLRRRGTEENIKISSGGVPL